MSETLAEPTRLSRIVENFNNKVRGIDIAIDVTHNPDAGAAGWIRKLELRESSKDPNKQSIWGFVEWTDFGRGIVGKDKRYRYISAEFDEYEDPETKQKFQDVLLAATVTNRPFVKWMEPIDEAKDGDIEILREGDYYSKQRWGDGKLAVMASEGDVHGFFRELYKLAENFLGKAKETEISHSEKEVTMHKIREFLVGLGAELSEEVTEDQILETLTEMLSAKDTKIAELTEKVEAEVKPDEKTEQLAETNTKLEEEKTTLEAEKAQLAERVKTIETNLAETKKNAFFEGILHEGKLAPAERKDFEALYDKAPEEVRKMLEDREPVVGLTGKGSSSDKAIDKEDDRIERINKLAEDENISVREATDRVLAEELEVK